MQVISSPALAPAVADDTEAHITEEQALKAASKSGEPVEVLSRRGETREVFAQPQGGFIAREHLRPVRTRKDGKWVAIDTSLKSSVDGVSPVAATVGLKFSGGGTGPMATMTRAGRAMSLTWPGELPAPELEGDTAVYKSVLPDVDLRLRADRDGFSHVLVVKTANAAKSPQLAALQLALSAPGLNVRVDEQGQQTVSDAVTGGTVFEAGTPRMWDSGQPVDAQSKSGTASGADEPADGQDLTEAPGLTSKVAEMKVEVADGQVRLEPDQALLTGADTNYPVYIDPRYSTPKSAANLMVSSNGWEDYNFTGDEGMGRCPKDLPPAGAYCNGDYVKRLFYRVPTSAFSGKEIISAEFSVRESWAPSCDGRSVHIYRVTGFASTSTWNSTKDNWAEYLDYRDVAKGHSSSCPAGEVRFNVVKAVRDAAKYGWANTTFGLRAGHEDDQYGWKKFSDEGYLQVYYNSPPPQPRASQMTMSPGGSCADHQWGSPVRINRLPMLYANNLTDPDAGGVEGEKLSAQFAVGWTDAATNTEKHWAPATGDIKKSAAAGSHKSSFSVQIPPNAVPQNVLLGWDVRVSDGRVWSPWASAGAQSRCYFIYDPNALPAPTITSTDYPALDPGDPEALPTKGVGRYGTFNVTFDTRVTKYAFGVNTSPSANWAKARTQTTEQIRSVPITSGLNQLRVRVWDAANNASDGVYLFWVTEGTEPKAHWKLNEQPGASELADTAAKSEGEASYPASISGGVTLGQPGVTDPAIKLNGIDGYAATTGPVLDTSKSFAVAAWAKITDASKTATIVAQDGAVTSAFFLQYRPKTTDRAPRWVFALTSADVAAPVWLGVESTKFQLNQWTHLAGVYDADAQKIRLYINGVWAGDKVVTTPWEATGPLLIGKAKWNSTPTSFTTGYIDEVRAYNRILTNPETNDLTNIKSHIMGLWHLNSQTDGTSPDKAPSNPHPMALAGNAAIVEDEGAAVTPPGTERAGVLSLSGSDGDYGAVNASVLDTGESFTVSAWVLTPGRPATPRTILALEGANNSAIAIRYAPAAAGRPIEEGRYVVEVAAGDATNAGKITVSHSSYHMGSYDEWDHIAVVFDGFNSTITLHVNGNKEAAEESPTVSYRENVRVFSPITSLQLGRGKTGGSYPTGQNWSGQLDEVWVLRGALDDDQVILLSDPTQKDDLYT
ncbi:LamG domain-containing protein [Actinomadura geliboluensis]|uniref:LamG domain-containing protein n=1 Tax=Actinomadura geliboluensis TaxID=882440 RepID=UPI0036A8F4AC